MFVRRKYWTALLLFRIIFQTLLVKDEGGQGKRKLRSCHFQFLSILIQSSKVSLSPLPIIFQWSSNTNSLFMLFMSLFVCECKNEWQALMPFPPKARKWVHLILFRKIATALLKEGKLLAPYFFKEAVSRLLSL